MAKVLNIDSLAPTTEPRSLNIDKVDYPIEEMSVELFLETTQLAEDLVGKSVGEQVKATIGLITKLVPTLPEEKLRKYKLAVLSKIAAFVRGEDEGEDVPAPAEGEAGK